MIGLTNSHFQVPEKLGEGGMWVVTEDQDTRFDRLVAFIFPPPELILYTETKPASFIKKKARLLRIAAECVSSTASHSYRALVRLG
jgi:hypothetical protein